MNTKGKTQEARPQAVTVERLTVYGGAGGLTGNYGVTIQMEGKADTVESVKSLIQAAPDLLAASMLIMAWWDNNDVPGNGARLQPAIDATKAAILRATEGK
jgi:hypothetical protein